MGVNCLGSIEGVGANIERVLLGVETEPLVQDPCIIGLLAQNGQWERALQMFDKLFGVVGEGAESSSSPSHELARLLKPDAGAYQAAILACAKGRKWDRAFAIFDALTNCEDESVRGALTRTEFLVQFLKSQRLGAYAYTVKSLSYYIESLSYCI
jgi:hypothetical protein